MYSKSKVSPLDRKVKPNPKYANIESTVNAGNNLKKELERMEEIRQYYKFKPDEIFRRISITSLVSLMIEVFKLELQLERQNYRQSLDADENSEKNGHSEHEYTFIDSVIDHRKKIRCHQDESKPNSVGNLIKDYENNENNDVEDRVRPFLILDVRTSEEFGERDSIFCAENYPHSRLSRSVNFESPSMIRFKNQDKKIIIVIDYDESVASKTATTLIERGYDNVFMLSGGLRVAKIVFPEKLIQHDVGGERARLNEEDILFLEMTLDEAMNRSSRLSTYAPSITQNSSRAKQRRCNGGI